MVKVFILSDLDFCNKHVTKDESIPPERNVPVETSEKLCSRIDPSNIFSNSFKAVFSSFIFVKEFFILKNISFEFHQISRFRDLQISRNLTWPGQAWAKLGSPRVGRPLGGPSACGQGSTGLEMKTMPLHPF